MKNKQSDEKIKIMILICLMFVGLNYAIHRYIFVPQTLQMDAMKSETLQADEQNTFLLNKDAEKEVLLGEVQELQGLIKAYDQIVLSQLDTINMSYEFYQFTKELGVVGKKVIYEVYKPDESGLPVDETLVVDETLEEVNFEVDEGFGVNEVIFEDPMSDTLYIKTDIYLEIEMEKQYLDRFLKSIANASKQKIIVNTIDVTAVQNLDTTGVVSGSEYLHVTVMFNAYIDRAASPINNQVYDFYSEDARHLRIEDLFKPQETSVE